MCCRWGCVYDKEGETPLGMDGWMGVFGDGSVGDGSVR